MLEQPKMPTAHKEELEPFELLATPKEEGVSLNTLSKEDSAISTEELMSLEFPLNKLKKGLEEYDKEDIQSIDAPEVNTLEAEERAIPETTEGFTEASIKPTTLSGIIKSQKVTIATLAVLAASLVPTENAAAADPANLRQILLKDTIQDATSSLKYQNNTSLRAAIQSGKVPASWVTNVNGKIQIKNPNTNLRQQAVGKLPRTSHFNTSTIDNENINLRPTDQFGENNYNKPGNYTTLKQHPSNVHIGKGIDPSSFQIDADPTSEVSIGNAPEDN